MGEVNAQILHIASARKKFTNVSKEIEDRNEDIRELKLENNRNLKGIKQLEKDIEEMEKEISERDDTIQDKENRYAARAEKRN